VDYFEVLIALAVLLFGALSGGRKKKPPLRRAPSPPPQRTSSPSRPPATTAERVADELRRRIEAARGHAEMSQVFTHEAQSLETPEPAGEASHQRFHDRYITALPEIVPRVTTSRVPAAGLRQAIVWSEILGPPKALRED
jgi:hypothetical protein